MPWRPDGDAVTIEDLLREEYFMLLPEMRRVAWELETEVRHRTLRIVQSLRQPEQIVVRSRVKECESAIKTWQRKNLGRMLDPDKRDEYSLLNLPDLAGARILVFPNSRVAQVEEKLRDCFPDWINDPIRDDEGNLLAYKRNGYFPHVSERVRGEYQIVPMLLGLFWEVEHAAMYKSQIANRFHFQDDETKEITGRSGSVRLRAGDRRSPARQSAGYLRNQLALEGNHGNHRRRQRRI